MKKKVYRIAALLVLVSISCQKDPSIVVNNCNKQVLIDKQLYRKAPNKFFDVSNVILDHDCLKVTYYHCGSNSDGNLMLIEGEANQNKFPTERNLRFSFDTISPCLALISHTQSFDLTPLKKFVSNHIILQIEQWKKPIHYRY